MESDEHPAGDIPIRERLDRLDDETTAGEALLGIGFYGWIMIFGIVLISNDCGPTPEGTERVPSFL